MDGLTDCLSHWFDSLIYWSMDRLIHYIFSGENQTEISWRNHPYFQCQMAHHPTHMPFIPSVGCNKHIISYHIPWISYAMNMPITMVFLGITPHLHIYIFIYIYIYRYPIIPLKKNITFAPDWRSHPLPPCGFSGGVKNIGRDDDHFGWDDVHHEI